MVHDNMSAQDVLRIVTNKGAKMKTAKKWLALNAVKGMLGESYDAIKAKVLHR